MRTPIRYAAMSSLFGLLLACTQAGDERLRPEQQPAGAPQACMPGENCPATYRYVPPEPVAPPVPNSPLNVDCETLPSQLERDTCVNRKLHTA